PACAPPQAIIIAPARKFSCLSMPSSRILAQSNPAGTSWSTGFRTNLYFCCACAENTPKPTSARKTPARITNKLIKTRTLKNPSSPKVRRTGADAEVECFFIVEFHWRARFLIETRRTINRFYLCFWTWQSLAHARKTRELLWPAPALAFSNKPGNHLLFVTIGQLPQKTQRVQGCGYFCRVSYFRIWNGTKERNTEIAA